MTLLCDELNKIRGVECVPEVAMAPYTSFRIGGVCKAFIRPFTLPALEEVLALLDVQDVPFRVLGRGSNLLVDDSGIGPVICLDHLDSRPVIAGKQDDSTFIVQAGAGMRLQALIAWTLKNSLTGLEPLAGIPASLGGAICMNAGANGISMNDVVDELLLTGPGGSSWVAASEIDFSYRSTNIPEGCLVTGARLRLRKGSPERSLKKIRSVMKKRCRTQPLGKANAGCVFKNPDEGPTGSLIEQCGLKGLTVGKAQVSRLHANFIVNLGGATSTQVMDLITIIQEKIKTETGIELRPEIHIWKERA